jgi:hypothetical protein
MGKLHKDTAMFMVQCLEKEDITDEQLIKVSLVASYIHIMLFKLPKWVVMVVIMQVSRHCAKCQLKDSRSASNDFVIQIPFC